MEWKSFRLDSSDRRYFYTDETKKIVIEDAEWFNKNTDSVIIFCGYETDGYNSEPISEPMFMINIEYRIANYFGNKGGYHYRDKWYVLKNDVLYKMNGYEPSTTASKMTKELKGIIAYLSNLSKEE